MLNKIVYKVFMTKSKINLNNIINKIINKIEKNQSDKIKLSAKFISESHFKDGKLFLFGTGHEDIAMDVVSYLTSGEAQYDLDTSWGLTPIMQYPEIGKVAPYNTDYWMMFIDAIADGGPEPLLVDYKAFQTVMNSMIQGAILGEGDAADLVAEAAEELEEYK